MPVKDVLEGWLTEEYDYERPRWGQIRQGEILKIEEGGITLDLGLKRDGFVPRSDLERLGKEAASSLELGQEVAGRILRLEGQDGNMVLSLYQARFEEDWKMAQELLESGFVWQGRVTEHNRGGLVAEFGRIRAFVPASHLTTWDRRRFSSDHREEGLNAYVGQELSLKVIEVNRDRRRLIASERLARQQMSVQYKERLLSELVEGQVCRGTVSGLPDFGAFVDLGGAEGLIHISELAWRRVRHPEEVVQVGDVIDVYVLRLDHERQRIGLSLKRLEPDPWTLVDETYSLDQLVAGRVTNVVDFGVFVALDLGVEGLVHVNELADPPPSHPRDVVQRGDELVLRILRIDSFRKRIGLSVKQIDDQEREEWLARRLDGPASEKDGSGDPHPDKNEQTPLPLLDEVGETTRDESEQTLEPEPGKVLLPAPAAASQEEKVGVSLLQDVEAQKA
jgi:small subunit ribosomal protein S1